MLHPASHPAHHSPWLPPVAFINNDQGYFFHITITKIYIGVDLEKIFLVNFQARAQGPQ